MTSSNHRYSLPRNFNAMHDDHSFDSVPAKNPLQFRGDLACERLCTDALQDINDDSDLGDIVNDHAEAAMTAAEQEAEEAYYASQHYRFKS